MLCTICQEGVKAAAARLSDVLRSPDQVYATTYGRHTGSRQVVVQLHQSVEDLRNSIETGCLFCRNLWARCLNERPELQDENGRINIPLLEHVTTRFRTGGSELTQLKLECRQNCIIAEYFDNSDWGAHKRTYSMSGISPETMEFDGFSDYAQSRPGEFPSSTRDSVALWQKWYRLCKDKHRHCRPSDQRHNFRPKRLIQVHEDDPMSWNLVDETSDITEPYMTLSHCWGASQPIRLKRSDIVQYKERNLITKLPKTFAEAIEVAKSLGIHYIWIDSLCIVQDDEADWREQSSLMRSIYTYSDCNIAATSSRGSSEGCFQTSDAALKHPTVINLGFELNGCSTYQLSRVSSVEDDLNTAPLNSRAWVFQERYLASRQLSFTASQVYWECAELVANEQCPGGLADELWTKQQTLSLWKKRLAPANDEDFRRIWSNVVEQYSSCALTKKTDKVIALSGLADHLERSQRHVGNTYRYGLWSRDFHRQLCWTSHFSVSEPEQLDNAIAPTWSWMNLDGRVQQDDAYNNPWGKYRISWIQVEDHDTSTASDGLLSLRGIALFGTLQDNDPFGQGRYNGKVLLSCPLATPDIEPMFSFEASFHWNVSHWPQDSLHPQKLCFFMVNMSLVTEEIHGLVLWQIPYPRGCTEYIRLGTVTLAGVYGRHTNSRTPIMQHMAARQGLPKCAEVLQEEEMGFHFRGADDYMQAREQRADKIRWAMDLDRTGMQDLVQTVQIR